MNRLEKHEANTRGRDFFVGDIHGQFDLLMDAMRGVHFDKEVDRLFSVGDLIDRGADSFKCLSLAFEPWFYSVRGNHEMLAHDALQDPGKAWDLWQMNGGSWVYLESAHEVRATLDEALRHLPHARQVAVAGKQIGMVHAEPPDDWADIEIVDSHRLVWGRNRISSMDTAPVTSIDAVVVGHTIVEEPTTLGNVHYIDTGAFTTGRLTLFEASEVVS
ncbi:metallophosphoesterase [Halomonas sp. BC04]|uniref:metallophosphoesterase n=1 Tax=Halomonas sp. BC04 TaxID=1403540 RepID=UPI0003ED5C29|nr:metallophosphoesterase [Halomonas sp. BC04]EWH03787.1 serine/threonine protein phosphatase [Halomonas sp. BC04]